MEQAIHIASKGKLHQNTSKNKTQQSVEIIGADHLQGLEVLIYFSNGEQRIVNFVKHFADLKGAYAKYAQIDQFKKFIVKNGNIYWGKNEDVIFPVDMLYNSRISKKPRERILYIF